MGFSNVYLASPYLGRQTLRSKPFYLYWYLHHHTEQRYICYAKVLLLAKCFRTASFYLDFLWWCAHLRKAKFMQAFLDGLAASANICLFLPIVDACVFCNSKFICEILPREHFTAEVGQYNLGYIYIFNFSANERTTFIIYFFIHIIFHWNIDYVGKKNIVYCGSYNVLTLFTQQRCRERGTLQTRYQL